MLFVGNSATSGGGQTDNSFSQGNGLKIGFYGETAEYDEYLKA